MQSNPGPASIQGVGLTAEDIACGDNSRQILVSTGLQHCRRVRAGDRCIRQLGQADPSTLQILQSPLIALPTLFAGSRELTATWLTEFKDWTVDSGSRLYILSSAGPVTLRRITAGDNTVLVVAQASHIQIRQTAALLGLVEPTGPGVYFFRYNSE